MAEAAIRDRPRTDTERHIREQAKKLLVNQGHEAVTLRAIARELGITAPALYRYYDSREDLIRQVCDDVCNDLTAELTAGLAERNDEDLGGQVFTICRLFRRWALTHHHEFSLVFATPVGHARKATGTETSADPFGRIFLTVAGPLMARYPLDLSSSVIPAELKEDLTRYRRTLVDSLAETGVEVVPGALGFSAMYLMFRFWLRLYGYVALEVFGRFPFSVSDPDAAFEAVLRGMFDEFGIPS